MWQPYTDQARHFMRFENAEAHPGKDLLSGMWELVEEDVNRRLTMPGVNRDYYKVGIASPTLPANAD